MFAISLFALLALLWASFAIAQHIRRARRRRRRFLESTAPLPTAPELSFADPAAPIQQHSAPPPAPAAFPFAQPREYAASSITAAPEPEVTLAAEENLEEPQPAPYIPEPLSRPISSAPEPEITVAAEDNLEQTEPEPIAQPAPEPVYDEAAKFPGFSYTKPRSLRPATPQKHPLASLVPPLERPDWAYFNKDMGDLSDPEPRHSSRPKIRVPHSD